MNTRSLQLAEIRLDGGTQCRAALNQEYIGSLVEAWAAGAKIPAVVVYHDGSAYWLADGFHRYHAAQGCEFRDIEAEVRSGTRTDAVRYALGANAAHGQPRTNADKRRAVEIALKEFPKLSSREIAKVCAVSVDTVCRGRPQLSDSDSCTRIGADGKERKMPAPKKSSPAYTPPDRTEILNGEGETGDETVVEASASDREAELAERRACFARPTLVVTDEEKAEIDRESLALSNLKFSWRKAGKRDRAAFLAWIKEEETK